MGIIKHAPDEFRVISHPDLIIPPNFNLLKPKELQNNHEPIVVNYNNDNISLNESDILFLTRLGLQHRNDLIVKELNTDNKNFIFYTDEENFKEKIKRLSSNSIMESKQVIKPAEENERIKQNIKANKPVTQGEVPVRKLRNNVLRNIFNE
jgi:hypothetical protein